VIDLVSASPYVAYLGPLMVLGMLIKSWGGFKTSKADATKTLVDSATGVVKTLRGEVDELEKDLAAARQKVKSLTADLAGAQAEITDLRGQVDRMSKDLTAAHIELERVRGEGRLP
jgi:outer membrane murein-binding lipoprotein Lpp